MIETLEIFPLSFLIFLIQFNKKINRKSMKWKKEKENSRHYSKSEWEKVSGSFFSLFEFCEKVLDICLGSLKSDIELSQNSG